MRAPINLQTAQIYTRTSKYELIVSEIVSTERGYVQALERLRVLKRLVQEQGVITAEGIGYVFGNVDELADFQRRFLDRLESVSLLSVEEQDWSAVFSMLDDAADAYITYIANHKHHLQAAIREQQNILKTTGSADILEQVADQAMIHLTFQRPYSRFAKYSCFLKELLQEIQADETKFAALQTTSLSYHRTLHRAGTALMEMSLNEELTKLWNLVEDWKGLQPNTFGRLVAFDTMRCRTGHIGRSERSFHVYLFEKVLLCCKKKFHGNGSPISPTLRLKGRIFLKNVLDFDTSSESSYRLNVHWKSADGVEKTTILFTSAGTMESWSTKMRQLWDRIPETSS